MQIFLEMFAQHMEKVSEKLNMFGVKIAKFWLIRYGTMTLKNPDSRNSRTVKSDPNPITQTLNPLNVDAVLIL